MAGMFKVGTKTIDLCAKCWVFKANNKDTRTTSSVDN